MQASRCSCRLRCARSASVFGEAVDDLGVGNRLRFAFEIDQAYLPPICRALDQLLAAFPVVGEPDA